MFKKSLFPLLICILLLCLNNTVYGLSECHGQCNFTLAECSFTAEIQKEFCLDLQCGIPEYDCIGFELQYYMCVQYLQPCGHNCCIAFYNAWQACLTPIENCITSDYICENQYEADIAQCDIDWAACFYGYCGPCGDGICMPDEVEGGESECPLDCDEV